jgi:hypothetical protein
MTEIPIAFDALLWPGRDQHDVNGLAVLISNPRRVVG